MHNLAIIDTGHLDAEWRELEIEELYAEEVSDAALALIEAEPMEMQIARNLAVEELLGAEMEQRAHWARMQEGGWHLEN